MFWFLRHCGSNNDNKPNKYEAHINRNKKKGLLRLAYSVCMMVLALEVHTQAHTQAGTHAHNVVCRVRQVFLKYETISNH